LLLNWGANDFGGTLVNESISTAAGAEYGQLLRPKEIRHLIRSIGRIPAERDTTYQKIKKFEVEPTESKGLDEVKDAKKFGSYFELIKIKKYQYKNPRKN
jgi:FO synthase subunit 2